MGGVSMETYKLSDLCEILDAKRKPLSALQRAKKQGIYPYYGAQGIIDHLDEYLLDGEYLLVAEDGANLETRNQPIANIAKGKIWVNNHAHVLGSNGKCPLNLLGFILNSMNISPYVTGCAQPKLNQENLRNIEIELPSHIDRIASILSSLDRKIELNNKINADLEEMAQAIFKNWFVDFEPFKDGKFVDSELGMIPEGWKVISLNEILDNVSGYSYKGSELQSSNIAMATIKNFERKGGFKTEGYKEIVISKKIKETQFVNMFDVLVAHTDLTQNAEIVGNPAIVLSKGGYEKLIMSMDLTKVIPKIEGVTNGLLYCILSTYRFKEHALGYVNGTTVLHMSKKAVPEYTCAFPKDINQIRDLCITLDSIYKRMAVTYDENSRLSLLRDTLLPRLMSGEIEVPE